MNKPLKYLLTTPLLFTLCLSGCGNFEMNGPETVGIGENHTEEIFKKVISSNLDIPLVGGNRDLVENKGGTIDFDMDIPGLDDEMKRDIKNGEMVAHAMNGNLLSSYVLDIEDSVDIDDFTNKLQENIKNEHWLCGVPEKLSIVDIENDYIVYTYGDTELVDLFTKEIRTHIDTANLLIELNL